MPRFLIRREIHGLGQMSSEELHNISKKSNSILAKLQRDGTGIQWNHSYVSDDTLHCVYVAPSAEAVRVHARCGGFPCDEVMLVRGTIDPTSGE